MTAEPSGLGRVRVECFMFADAAQQAGGKLYILGAGWEKLYASAFPVNHPMVGLAIKLAVPWIAISQRHTLTIDLVDEDSQSILPAPFHTEFEVTIPPDTEPGDDIVVTIAATLAPLTIPKPGRYVFRLLVNDETLARSVFRAVQLPQPPRTPFG
ncbi:MAG: hypothetical protein NZ518_04145 [Dehalococcoidia bacterium]|nr:hypothetical protein [Dehalococcoidia bacterium]